jgi:hypothetical protein
VNLWYVSVSFFFFFECKDLNLLLFFSFVVTTKKFCRLYNTRACPIWGGCFLYLYVGCAIDKTDGVSDGN